MTNPLTSVNEASLRPIIASLYYLSEESKRSGFDEVSNVILATISRVEAILKGQGCNIIDIVVNSDTINALKIMDIISKFPLYDYTELVNTLEFAESDLMESLEEL